MSGSKRRRRRPRPAAAPAVDERPEELDELADEEPAPRRVGPFGAALFGAGESPLPPMGRSLGRGLLAVAAQPAIVLLCFALVLATWLALLAIGFEGVPGRLVAVLALPPISTYFDLGTGTSLYGATPSFLVFVGAALVVRAIVTAVLAGMVVEALEDGRVTTYSLLRAVQAIPTAFVVQVGAFSLVIAGSYIIFPLLGSGLGFLGLVSALVGGLFFLGFAPIAAVRQGRPVMETIRRSGRAAMLPGGRHLLLSSLYFFLALPIVVGFAPGSREITANPTLFTWVFALVVNVVHVGFMAAFAYRWIVAEPAVPEQPVRRRPPPRTAPARARRR